MNTVSVCVRDTTVMDNGHRISTHTERHREARVERKCILEELDLLVRERDVQRRNVCLQMLDLSPSDDREHMRRLVHDVGDRHLRVRLGVRTAISSSRPPDPQITLTRLDARNSDLSRNLLQRFAHLALLFRPLPICASHHPAWGRV